MMRAVMRSDRHSAANSFIRQREHEISRKSVNVMLFPVQKHKDYRVRWSRWNIFSIPRGREEQDRQDVLSGDPQKCKGKKD